MVLHNFVIINAKVVFSMANSEKKSCHGGLCGIVFGIYTKEPSDS